MAEEDQRAARGLAISATGVPFTHSLTGGLLPYIPLRSLAIILGTSAGLSVVSLAVPTRRALRNRPISALAGAE